MKTQDLIALLATHAAPVEPNAAARRYGLALGLGTSGAVLMLLVQFGVRADIAEAVLLPMFWIKLASVACIATAGLHAAARLSRPGARIGLVPVVLAAPLLILWGIAAWTLAGAGASERAELVLGKTWYEAPFDIAILSIPALVAAFWAMTGFAPTRLSLSGGAAGLFAGGIGALAYSFHCTEMAAPFVAIWYFAGVLLPVAAGAALGPILLRW
ncbi:MAG: DUF1109 domain-containing protein [Betaproteobacteria bacterium]|nr:MAG: DUF1109 domain-containing protein [Betaproteobacteria bacterium]